MNTSIQRWSRNSEPVHYMGGWDILVLKKFDIEHLMRKTNKTKQNMGMTVVE